MPQRLFCLRPPTPLDPKQQGLPRSSDRLLATRMPTLLHCPQPWETRTDATASEGNTSGPEQLTAPPGYGRALSAPVFLSVKWLGSENVGRNMSTLSTIRLHHVTCLSPSPLHPDLPALRLRQNLPALPFQRPRRLSGWRKPWVGSVLPLLSPQQCEPGEASRGPGSGWPPETHVLPLPVAAHIGVLGVQREDGPQEGEGNERCR